MPVEGSSEPSDAKHDTSFESLSFSDKPQSTCKIFPREGPFIVELFAGSGRVTAHLKYYGIRDSFGVDHKNLSSIAPIMVCDLTTAEGQRLCTKWVNSESCAGVFAAPPCGTCSRAREIQLRDSKGRKIPCPPPLRSDSAPNGLPNLSQHNRQRVSSANKLYHFLSELVLSLVSKGIPVVIENPRSSLYWLTTYFQEFDIFFPLQHIRHALMEVIGRNGRR